MPAVRARTRPTPWLGVLPGLIVAVTVLALIGVLLWNLAAR